MVAGTSHGVLQLACLGLVLARHMPAVTSCAEVAAESLRRVCHALVDLLVATEQEQEAMTMSVGAAATHQLLLQDLLCFALCHCYGSTDAGAAKTVGEEVVGLLAKGRGARQRSMPGVAVAGEAMDTGAGAGTGTDTGDAAEAGQGQDGRGTVDDILAQAVARDALGMLHGALAATNINAPLPPGTRGNSQVPNRGSNATATSGFGVHVSVCRLAQRVNYPGLVLAALSLLRRHPTFGSRAPETRLLRDYAPPPPPHVPVDVLVALAPRLYLATFDPVTSIKATMRALWRVLVLKDTSGGALILESQSASSSTSGTASGAGNSTGTDAGNNTTGATNATSRPASSSASDLRHNDIDPHVVVSASDAGARRALQLTILRLAAGMLESGVWREREAAAALLSTYVPRFTGSEVGVHMLDQADDDSTPLLPLMWGNGLRVMDDIRDGTRAAGLGLMKVLADSLLRVLEQPAAGGAGGLGVAVVLGFLVPQLLEKGLVAHSPEIRGFSMGVLLRVLKVAARSQALTPTAVGSIMGTLPGETAPMSPSFTAIFTAAAEHANALFQGAATDGGELPSPAQGANTNVNPNLGRGGAGGVFGASPLGALGALSIQRLLVSKGWLVDVLDRLVEAMSALEPRALQYMALHTDQVSVTESLDSVRLRLSESSPIQEGINYCLHVLTEATTSAVAVGGEGGVQATAVCLHSSMQRLGAHASRGVGLLTRVAGARGLATLADHLAGNKCRLSDMARGAASRALKQLVGYLVSGQGATESAAASVYMTAGGNAGANAGYATLRSAVATAVGSLSKIAPPQDVGGICDSVVDSFERLCGMPGGPLALPGTEDVVAYTAAAEEEGQGYVDYDDRSLALAAVVLQMLSKACERGDVLTRSTWLRLSAVSYVASFEDEAYRIRKEAGGASTAVLGGSVLGEDHAPNAGGGGGGGGGGGVGAPAAARGSDVWKKVWNECLQGAATGNKLTALVACGCDSIGDAALLGNNGGGARGGGSVVERALRLSCGLLQSRQWGRRLHGLAVLRDVSDCLPRMSSAEAGTGTGAGGAAPVPAARSALLLLDAVRGCLLPPVLAILESLPGPIWEGQGLALEVLVGLLGTQAAVGLDRGSGGVFGVAGDCAGGGIGVCGGDDNGDSKYIALVYTEEGDASGGRVDVDVDVGVATSADARDMPQTRMSGNSECATHDTRTGSREMGAELADASDVPHGKRQCVQGRPSVGAGSGGGDSGRGVAVLTAADMGASPAEVVRKLEAFKSTLVSAHAGSSTPTSTPTHTPTVQAHGPSSSSSSSSSSLSARSVRVSAAGLVQLLVQESVRGTPQYTLSVARALAAVPWTHLGAALFAQSAPTLVSLAEVRAPSVPVKSGPMHEEDAALPTPTAAAAVASETAGRRVAGSAALFGTRYQTHVPAASRKVTARARTAAVGPEATDAASSVAAAAATAASAAAAAVMPRFQSTAEPAFRAKVLEALTSGWPSAAAEMAGAGAGGEGVAGEGLSAAATRIHEWAVPAARYEPSWSIRRGALLLLGKLSAGVIVQHVAQQQRQLQPGIGSAAEMQSGHVAATVASTATAAAPEVAMAMEKRVDEVLMAATLGMEDSKHARLRQAAQTALQMLLDTFGSPGAGGLYSAVFGPAMEPGTPAPPQLSATQRGRQDRLNFVLGLGSKDAHPDVRAAAAAASTANRKQVILGRHV